MGQTAATKSSKEFYDTDLSVGEILRRTRTHYGQSLQDVERAIRVRAVQIEAIENNQTDKLPGRVYAIGFVRSYSEYLGLDGSRMVDLFKRQEGGKDVRPELDFPVPASESKLPPLWLVGLSVAMVLAVSVALWSFSGSEEEGLLPQDQIPAVPGEFHSENFSAINTEGAADSVQATNENEILINVVENSWVEVKDAQAKVLISRILEAGEQYYLPNRSDLTITLGNAGGVQFDDGAGSFIAFGAVGDSVNDLPLNLEALKARYPQTSAPVATTTEQTPSATTPDGAQTTTTPAPSPSTVETPATVPAASAPAASIKNNTVVEPSAVPAATPPVATSITPFPSTVE